MKIQRGNLLTVILAMLCAALIALGVGVALPKSEKSANAAMAASFSQEIKLANASERYHENSPTVSTYESMSVNNMNTPFRGSKTINDTTISYNQDSSTDDMPARGLYVGFDVSVTVPAYEEWNITYGLDFSCVTTILNYAMTQSAGVYYYKPDTSVGAAPNATLSSSNDINLMLNGYTSSNASMESKGYANASKTWGINESFHLDSDSPTTLKNDTAAPRTFTRSYGMSVYIGGGNTTRHIDNLSVTFSTRTVNSVKVLPPVTSNDTSAISDAYTGSKINFNINNFLNDCVNITSVKGTDFDGDSITSISTADIDVNGVFDPTLAGVYKVAFELNPDATMDGVTWFDGTITQKTLTFTINPKKLTIPKITNSPQTYDPTNGNHFTVDSNFDATTMKALTVPDPSPDISWNAGSSCFDATAAGTYSVKFQLKDTKNYVWDKGANGTTADQPATVKVEPKKLTIPTITAPQEYTGGALQFVLADFNAGAYIKVDSATGTGSNTVTGAGGATITDTTDTFEATNVGKYTVKLSLRNATNYAWDDGTTLPKDIDFEITQKELLSTSPVSSSVNGTGGAEWEFSDSTVTITITDARVGSENINLLCYYDVAGGTSKSNTLTATTVGNVTTITMPATIAVGNYTLTVELNGSTGDNANYKITKNNTLNFEVTSGKIDPSTYGWIYTKDGAAGSTIADGDKLPFELKAGNSVDGVKYELSIQIPSSDSFVIVDTSKYTAGYLTRSGNSVNTYTTTVALKSTDPNNLFEVNGNKQDTCEVEFNWEIEKGTFNLSGVKWEYSLNGTSGWTDYNPANPPQYNDGYDITVRVKASTLPAGLILDSLYEGIKESVVGNYTATIQTSDFNYDTNNFNAPNTSLLNLNWDIVKKNLYKSFKNVAESFSNANYSGTIILKQLDLDSTFAGYIDYVYYLLPANTLVTLQDIKDAVDLTNPQNYKVEAYINPAYAANYTVDDNGSTPSDQFKTGSNNKLADAAIDNATVVYDGNTHFDVSRVTVTGSDSMNVTDFTVKYYKGTTPVAANELPAGELPKDAGDYCIEVILGTQAESKYILVTDRLTVKIEAMGIDLPTLGVITFNGKEQNFADNLSGSSWTTYGPAGMNIIKVDGKLSDRNVGAGNYTTTLELTDSNYKWIYPDNKSLGKSVVKYALAVDGVKVTGDDKTATYNWNLTPLIVDTTNMWNKGSKGATLNLPQNIRDLIAGGTLEVGYRYYSDGQYVEEPELKGGRSFKVEAVFAGDDAERNVQFKRSDTEFGAVSKDMDYTVPTSGAAAFMGKVKDALSQTWLGLPIWAWLLIALALIILLIIIIVVAVKRRKTKEEREAKKAAKEEERLRREEEREAERQRREDERRMQQEKLEAERELARAKQEAEIEKIKAQAQAGMAGAGMATMAMAQQPAQQQPQPVQQPVQQVVDNTNNELIKEMREQMAEMRAENRAAREQLRSMQYQQAMPQPMYQPQPVQAAAPAAGSDLMTLMDLKVQMAEMKSAQALAELKTAQAIAEAKGANKQSDNDRQYSQNYPNYGGYPSVNMGYGMQSIPAPQAVMTPYGMLPAPQQVMTPYGVMPAYGYPPVAMLPQPAYAPVQPKKEEVEPVVTATSQTTPSMTMSRPPYCPPGAVMTTTTTIDTSKSMENKSTESSNNVKSGDLRRTAADSADDITFDVDGFYDPLE